MKLCVYKCYKNVHMYKNLSIGHPRQHWGKAEAPGREERELLFFVYFFPSSPFLIPLTQCKITLEKREGKAACAVQSVVLGTNKSEKKKAAMHQASKFPLISDEVSELYRRKKNFF